MFLASASTAGLANEARQECPEKAQPAISDDRGPRSYPSAEQQPDAARRAVPRVSAAITAAGLPAPTVVGLSEVKIAGQDVTLYSRADSLEHVQRVAGGGAGVWLPQTYATQARLQPGMPVRIGSATTRVAGIYRDLAPSAFVPLFALPRYWCSWSELIVPTIFNQPPPFVLVDQTMFFAASSTVDLTWYARVDIRRQTLPQSRASVAAMQRAFDSLPAAKLYRQVGDLPFLQAKAQRERDGLRGPVVPVAIAGMAVALALVGACGAFWALRRRREVTLLHFRGVGRVGIATKAALELSPGVVLGTVAGWLTGIALVTALGPANRLEPGATTLALQYAIGAGGAGLLVAACVAGRGAPSDVRTKAQVRKERWRRLPWELGLVGAAVAAYVSVRRNGAVHIVKATVQVDPMVLAFPLLALLAALAVLMRAGRLVLLHSSNPAQRLPVPAYLAARRLAGTPMVALGTLVGVALPLAVLLYSSALSGSTTDDVVAKNHANVGADHAFGTIGSHGNPATGGFGTVVSRIQVDPRVNGLPITVLGVDPATFSTFAADGRSVAAVTQRLTGSGALLVNAPHSFTATVVQFRSVQMPVRVVARRASFPGLRNPYLPMIVVNREAIPTLSQLVDRTEEVWTTDRDFVPTVNAMRAAHIDIGYEVTTDTFLDNTGLRPVTWIFGYLQALAALTGLVAFAGVTAAFTSRTRRRALAYHLSRRMGLSQREHRASLGLEIGTLLTLSWTAGTGLGLGAVALVYRLTDPYPDFPPPPSLPVPVAALVASAAAAVLLGAVGTLALQRLLDRTPVPLRS